jgi:microcystin-dependent protein
MSRVLTSAISGIDCLILSLSTINTNFSNLDTTVCAASSTFKALNLTTIKGPVGDSVYGIPGIITAYAGVHIPNYWTACDGSELDRSSYPDLYDIVGDNFGSPSNSNKFVLPDLRSVNGLTAPRGSTSISSGNYSTVTVAPTALLTITSSASSKFGTQTSYPSGFYRVQYVTGGYCLGSNSSWTGHIGYRCNLVHSNNSHNVVIGVYDTTLTQSYDTLIINGQNYNGTGIPWYYDFLHTGGPIYIYLVDNSYNDNTTGNAAGYNPSTPVYSLYSVISTVALSYIISTNN